MRQVAAQAVVDNLQQVLQLKWGQGAIFLTGFRELIRQPLDVRAETGVGSLQHIHAVFVFWSGVQCSCCGEVKVAAPNQNGMHNEAGGRTDNSAAASSEASASRCKLAAMTRIEASSELCLSWAARPAARSASSFCCHAARSVSS